MNFVTMEIRAIQTNVMDLAQGMCMVGIVQEEAHQLLQIVSLSVEMAFEQDLKHVMTESPLKTIKSASMIVQDLKLAGLAQNQ